MISVTQNKVNLCSSCKHGYPSCPAKVADVLYGDGTGYDNICCCAYYKPKCDTEEAYQRGLSEGNDIGYKDGVKDGQNEAWECAKKLFSTMAESDIERAFPIEWNSGGFKALMNLQPLEAIERLKSYEDNKIKRGDIVNVKGSCNDGLLGVVTKVLEDNCYIMWGDGLGGAWSKDSVIKTGKHIDVDKFFEEIAT